MVQILIIVVFKEKNLLLARGRVIEKKRGWKDQRKMGRIERDEN